MKITMLLTLMLICTHTFAFESNSALRRSNGLLRFIAEQEGMRDFALSTIIGNRCGRYMEREGKAPCKAAVKKMIQVLDYDVIFSKDKKTTPPKPDETWSPRSFVFVQPDFDERLGISALMTLVQATSEPGLAAPRPSGLPPRRFSRYRTSSNPGGACVYAH